MNPANIIYENFPHCSEWSDDSFLGILHEDCRIDMNAYWQLEWAVVNLTTNAVDYPRHLSWPIFRIFVCVVTSLSSHTDPNDSYNIKNVNSDFIRIFNERFQMVFEGFFRGDTPDLKHAFDESNPLLE